MRRGEVWWHESEAGRRPCLILTRDAAIDVLDRVVVVPATTTIRDIPTEVRLTVSDGMPRECVLSFDNISTVRKSLCVERITTLSTSKMLTVCDALRTATGCDPSRLIG